MMEHKEPPKWVAAQAECKLDVKFEALLQIVERDVAEFNGLYDRNRRGQKFKLEKHDEGCRPWFSVELDADVQQPPRVNFSLERTAIRINGAGKIFSVAPAWSSQQNRCVLVSVTGDIDRGPWEVWQISQVALSNLFFGPWQDTG